MVELFGEFDEVVWVFGLDVVRVVFYGVEYSYVVWR